MPRVPTGPNDVWGQALNEDLDSIEAKAEAALDAVGDPDADLAAYYVQQKQ